MASNNITTPGKGNGVEEFFARCGFSSYTRDQCWLLVREILPDVKIEEASPQGYCSYTLCAGHDKIIQFRPPAHKLHMAVAEAACNVYGNLAPTTQLLTILKPNRVLSSKDGHSSADDPQAIDEGVVMEDSQDFLDVLCMKRVRGISLSDLRASPTTLSKCCRSTTTHQLESLVRHFAQFIAIGWLQAHKTSGSDNPAYIPGRIGGSLRWRLERMHACLPPRFQPFVSRALDKLDQIASLPWVLTHGDIVPANIMVEPLQGTPGECALTGLLDWAEAEYLPFGVALYGLEELLGETDANGRFAYYSGVTELRAVFWAHLETDLAVGGLALDSALSALVDDAHILGVLLWHGIAFDNGKLDRVVQEGHDDEEILRLDLFFAGRR